MTPLLLDQQTLAGPGPFKVARHREAATTFPIQLGQPPKRSATGHASILIVDDCFSLRDILSQMLSLAGYRVETAVSGPEALAKSRANRPALMLLTAGLPGVNGHEFYTQLRQEPATRHMPIILTTVYGAWWPQPLATTWPQSDFLTIPVSYQTLLRRVAQELRSQASRDV